MKPLDQKLIGGFNLLTSGVRFISQSLVCLVFVACSKPQEEPRQPEPAPRTVLALNCSSFHSTVTFRAQPDSQQLLEATYQGADQAHWWFGASHDPGAARRLRYRSADSIYAIEPGSGTSLEFTGEDRAACMLQLELRRALMLWPDGFDWKETDIGFSFELLDGSGRLLVEIEDDLPIRFYSRNSQGVQVESFGELTWQEFQGRRFPQTMVLSVGGHPVWDETLTEIIPDCEYVSFFFLPSDRRPKMGPSTGQTAELRHLDLPERLTSRIPLDAGLSWDEVRTRGSAALAKAVVQLPGFAQKLAFAIEIDAEAKPTALLILLDAPREVPTEGPLANWTRHGTGPALSVLLSNIRELTPGKLLALRRFLPEGSQAGALYLRLPPEDDAELPMQLVLCVKAG